MDIGLQARIAIQVVVLGDALAVREDLGSLGVFVRGDVAELLQQRDVHIGLDVAGDPRIPIPIPRAAHIGRSVDQSHTFDAELAQPRSRQQPPEARPDDGHVDLVGQRLARELPIGPGVIGELGELTRDLHVLRDAVGAQSPCPLFGVLLPQRINVERAPNSLGQGLDPTLREPDSIINRLIVSSRWRPAAEQCASHQDFGRAQRGLVIV